MQALAQSIIAGKTVYLQGAKISPAQVASYVDHKKKQLRSGVFLIDQLDGECNGDHRVEASPFTLRPGPWRQTWDVEEIYAMSDVDKFAKAEVV